jgi:hypothetical protein
MFLQEEPELAHFTADLAFCWLSALSSALLLSFVVLL